MTIGEMENRLLPKSWPQVSKPPTGGDSRDFNSGSIPSYHPALGSLRKNETSVWNYGKTRWTTHDNTACLVWLMDVEGPSRCNTAEALKRRPWLLADVWGPQPDEVSSWIFEVTQTGSTHGGLSVPGGHFLPE